MQKGFLDLGGRGENHKKKDGGKSTNEGGHSSVGLGPFPSLTEAFSSPNTVMTTKIKDLERQMIDGNLVLVGDDGQPLKLSRSNTGMEHLSSLSNMFGTPNVATAQSVSEAPRADSGMNKETQEACKSFEDAMNSAANISNSVNANVAATIFANSSSYVHTPSANVATTTFAMDEQVVKKTSREPIITDWTTEDGDVNLSTRVETHVHGSSTHNFDGVSGFHSDLYSFSLDIRIVVSGGRKAAAALQLSSEVVAALVRQKGRRKMIL